MRCSRWLQMTIVVVGIGVASVMPSAQQSGTTPSLSIARALDMYAAGNPAEAVAGRPFDRLNVETIISALDAWIATAPSDHRQHLAARFAVDVLASQSRTVSWTAHPAGDSMPSVTTPRPGDHERRPWPPIFPDDGVKAPLVVWAARWIPSEGPIAEWEPLWWRASVAVLQEAREWGVLMGNARAHYSGPPRPQWQLRVHQAQEHGHLTLAIARLGETPWLQMARAVGTAAPLTDARVTLTVGAPGGRPNVFGRPDVLRVLTEASRQANRGRFTEVERALEPLLAVPELEGEAAVRLALLRLLRGDWTAAHRWLDRASVTPLDSVYLATIDYLRGWVHDNTNQPAHALESYRRAYDRYPASPNLNTRFAMHLMKSGERDRAAQVLETSMHLAHNERHGDLLSALIGGDARFGPVFARRMRDTR